MAASANAGKAFRDILLGNQAVASKASGAFAADTRNLFTTSGGLVLITAIWGVVTTAITVADTVKLTSNPTAAGDTVDLVTATDLGTTDTAAGTIIGTGAPTQTAAPSLVRGGILGATTRWLVQPGVIEQVTTGTGPDGAITWNVAWLPMDAGATLAPA